MNFLVLNSNNSEETEKIGESLGKLLQPNDVVCLIGELGAGKTALSRGVGRGWGSKDRVTSPTFTLMNEYRRESDGCILYHLDCYRLNDDDDVETIGLEDVLDSGGAMIIEWPQVAMGWLPEDRLTLEFEIVSDSKRTIRIYPNGDRSNFVMNQISSVKIK